MEKEELKKLIIGILEEYSVADIKLKYNGKTRIILDSEFKNVAESISDKLKSLYQEQNNI